MDDGFSQIRSNLKVLYIFIPNQSFKLTLMLNKSPVKYKEYIFKNRSIQALNTSRVLLAFQKNYLVTGLSCHPYPNNEIVIFEFTDDIALTLTTISIPLTHIVRVSQLQFQCLVHGSAVPKYFTNNHRQQRHRGSQLRYDEAFGAPPVTYNHP